MLFCGFYDLSLWFLYVLTLLILVKVFSNPGYFGFNCSYFCFFVHAKLVERNVLHTWLVCLCLSVMNILWLRQYSPR